LPSLPKSETCSCIRP